MPLNNHRGKHEGRWYGSTSASATMQASPRRHPQRSRIEKRLQRYLPRRLPSLRKTLEQLRWHLLGKEHFERYMFKKRLGYPLNLDAPQTYNEKMAWRKVRQAMPRAPELSDKLLVRDFVAQRGGSRYLKDVIAEFRPGDHIDFDALPDAFAIKAAHASGMNLFIADKNAADLQAVRRRMSRYLATRDYGKYKNEWWYSKLQPRLLIEPLVFRPGLPVIEYEIFVYDGIASVIGALKGTLEHANGSYYTRDWQGPLRISRTRVFGLPMERPANLDELVSLAESLGRGFDFIRVDLQVAEHGAIYFGEITLAPRSGWSPYYPDGADLFMGSHWKPRPRLDIDWPPPHIL